MSHIHVDHCTAFRAGTLEQLLILLDDGLFKVVSFEESPSALLDRAAAVEDTAKPNLEEISRIVHELRARR